jgi:hypothetical protein
LIGAEGVDLLVYRMERLESDEDEGRRLTGLGIVILVRSAQSLDKVPGTVHALDNNTCTGLWFIWFMWDGW